MDLVSKHQGARDTLFCALAGLCACLALAALFKRRVSPLYTLSVLAYLAVYGLFLNSFARGWFRPTALTKKQCATASRAARYHSLVSVCLLFYFSGGLMVLLLLLSLVVAF